MPHCPINVTLSLIISSQCDCHFTHSYFHTSTFMIIRNIGMAVEAIQTFGCNRSRTFCQLQLFLSPVNVWSERTFSPPSVFVLLLIFPFTLCQPSCLKAQVWDIQLEYLTQLPSMFCSYRGIFKNMSLSVTLYLSIFIYVCSKLLCLLAV